MMCLRACVVVSLKACEVGKSVVALAMEYDEIEDSEDENVILSGPCTRIFSVAQTTHLNSLYKSGMISAAKRHRPLLEKALLIQALLFSKLL